MKLSDFFENLHLLKQKEESAETRSLRNTLASFLIREYAEKAARVFYRQFNDYDLCEDLTQELYTIIFLKLHQLKGSEEPSLKAWIASIVRTLICEAIRKKRKAKCAVVPDEELEHHSDGKRGLPDSPDPEREEKVKKALSDGQLLTSLERKVIELKMKGLDGYEIHQALEKEEAVSYEYTRVILCRALGKLKKFLARTEE